MLCLHQTFNQFSRAKQNCAFVARNFDVGITFNCFFWADPCFTCICTLQFSFRFRFLHNQHFDCPCMWNVKYRTICMVGVCGQLENTFLSLEVKLAVFLDILHFTFHGQGEKASKKSDHHMPVISNKSEMFQDLSAQRGSCSKACEICVCKF